jgi:hypothetical protein
MTTPYDRNRHVAVKTLYIKKLDLMVICSFLSLLFSLIYLTMLSIAQLSKSNIFQLQHHLFKHIQIMILKLVSCVKQMRL